MDKNDINKRVLEDEDYIRCPKCNNSLKKFELKNPNGVDEDTIAKLLTLPKEEVERLYEEAIRMLQEDMVEDE